VYARQLIVLILKVHPLLVARTNDAPIVYSKQIWQFTANHLFHKNIEIQTELYGEFAE